MNTTCHPVVSTLLAASMDYVCPRHAGGKQSAWLWQRGRGWRGTWRVATTAWERCLIKRGNSLLLLMITFLPLWHLPSKRFSIWVSEEHFLFDKPLWTLLTAPGMAKNWPDAGDLVRWATSWAQQIKCFEENGVIQPEWPSTCTVLRFHRWNLLKLYYIYKILVK